MDSQDIKASNSAVYEEIYIKNVSGDNTNYEHLRFGGDCVDRTSRQGKYTNQSGLSCRFAIVIVAMVLLVSVVSNIITGYVVYTIVKNDQNELKGMPETKDNLLGDKQQVMMANISDLDLRVQYLSELQQQIIDNSNDGDWSIWSAWGPCSSNCSEGLQSRSRNCDSPRPSKYGKQCPGNNESNKQCNAHVCPIQCKTCTSEVIIFSVGSASSILSDGTTLTGIPVYTQIITNIGNCYNKTTGKFTCTVSGTYQFGLSFMTEGSSTNCYIRLNGRIIVRAQAAGASPNTYQSASTSTYITLTPGDVVYTHCYRWHNVDHVSSTFYGALVAPN